MSKTAKLFSNSINTKLISLFLLISIIPVVIIGIISVNNAHDELQRAEFTQLESVGVLKAKQITSYLENKFLELDVLAKSGDAFLSYEKLYKYHEQGGARSDGSYNVSTNEYKKIHEEIDPFFKVFLETFFFDDMYMICADHGHVMYSAQNEADLGTNLSVGKYRDSGLGNIWKLVKNTKKSGIVDYSIYQVTGVPAAFIGAPVFDGNGKLVAVIALEIKLNKINEIMQESIGLGETGETYLVGEDFLMRSNSRFSAESTILKRRIETESVKLGLQGLSGVQTTENYNGTEVLTYYTQIDFGKFVRSTFSWVMIAEINRDEALANAHVLANEIIIIAIIIAIFVALLAYFFARYFTKPIKRLTAAAGAAALGDLRQHYNINQKDEIGVLADAFTTMQKNMLTKVNQASQISHGDLTVEVIPLSEKDEMGKAFQQMVKNLREHIDKIVEVVSVLTSSNSQLMATIAQLSSSSSETATTVSEISTTIEEVKQTAEVSAEKAKTVSGSAQKSVQIAEKGMRSTEDSVEGMNLIHEQVKQIAETIIKLSEQSQAIGEITNSVNDIAEQSNLLAVNASIEAVKAGEYGKGFGVVAQEIRALSNQSKQSTKQIKDILSVIQKAISSAVMATEQGGKAVDKGVQLAEAAGDSISLLADSISEASQSTIQIATSSQQQLTGMEQLASAMENIKQAASQNAAGTKQTEDAIRNLKTIVENLNTLIGQYKLK